MIAVCWRTKRLGPDIVAHVVHQLAQIGIVAPRRMHEAGKQLVEHGAVFAGLARGRSWPRRRAVASGVSGRAWVLISASFATRSGACRMISKAM